MGANRSAITAFFSGQKPFTEEELIGAGKKWRHDIREGVESVIKENALKESLQFILRTRHSKDPETRKQAQYWIKRHIEMIRKARS